MFTRQDDVVKSDILLEEFYTKYRVPPREFPTGVTLLGDNRFKAYVRENGKEISKYFNIRKLGYDNALSLAIEWRKEREVK